MLQCAAAARGVGGLRAAFHFGTETTEDTVKHHFARSAALLSAAAAIAVAGCGDDDKDGSAATATQTQATATATATQTETATTQTRTQPRPAGQREAVVPGEQAKLEAGDDIGLTVKVERVYDPVATAVDRAQPGNKLVGVVVTGQSKAAVEPTRTTAYTSLETTAGTIKGTRVIADGDCAGSFTAAALLGAVDKPKTGCIGFEIPRKATPKSLTIVLTSPEGTKQATWKLPQAR